MNTLRLVFISSLALALSGMVAHSSEQRFFELSSCAFLTGDEPCIVGYRVYGKRNADGSNIILAPTWMGGVSGDFEADGYLGSGRLLDTDKFQVIIVDAFGNGVSTSPSNVPRGSLQQFEIADMVDAQFTLLTEELKVDHLHAIVGISMGGLQAFEWVEQHRDFVSKITTIISAIEIGAHDRANWEAQIAFVELLLDRGDGEELAYAYWAGVDGLIFRSPALLEQTFSETSLGDFWAGNEAVAGKSPVADRLSQMRSIASHNIASALLDHDQTPMPAIQYIYAPGDRALTPDRSLKRLELTNAEIIALPSDCGHFAFFCDTAFIVDAVDRFLTTSAAK